MPDLKPFQQNSAEHLRLVIETGHIGIWELDVKSGQAWRNRIHDEIFGYPEMLDEWTYEQFLDHIVEKDRERVDNAQQDAIANGREWVFECRITRADGAERWISAAGRPLLDEQGETVKLIGHVIDVTETKRKEARLELLTEELNHRVRNMLAMITSMVKLTGAVARDIPSFTQTLLGRVGALARTQELIVGDTSTRMPPSAILRQELQAFPDLGRRTDISVAGEQELRGFVGQGLALVFHELITNAVKYGAFSNDHGRVAVRFDVQDGVLHIDWKETGGPPVEPQESTGFGTRLIAGAIGSYAKVDLQFPEDGVHCEIALTLGPETA
ncbi:PAS domain-containing protein [Aurantiacibacter sp. MUD11]|uniref:sensor histidine kinase n=1 Tax=Aurantiacibacter sp. MUD11 TaxID=3003265 RepID=UPI0022AA2DD2|nr:PAS domain-containing protein [Aurantiacibacter sp. MUD11]WAT18715.1 PAS domain-containing protein [Aurantiacibacter sp. MUD11]